MTRMTREFSLVLVGSGILTAGYFLYPDDAQAKEDEAINNQVAGQNNNSSYRRTGPGFLFIHTGGWGTGGSSSVRGPATASAGRTGGFGSLGRASAGS